MTSRAWNVKSLSCYNILFVEDADKIVIDGWKHWGLAQLLGVQISFGLAAKLFKQWTWLCRETFFSPDMPEADVERLTY